MITINDKEYDETKFTEEQQALTNTVVLIDKERDELIKQHTKYTLLVHGLNTLKELELGKLITSLEAKKPRRVTKKKETTQ